MGSDEIAVIGASRLTGDYSHTMKAGARDPTHPEFRVRRNSLVTPGFPLLFPGVWHKQRQYTSVSSGRKQFIDADRHSPSTRKRSRLYGQMDSRTTQQGRFHIPFMREWPNASSNGGRSLSWL